MLMTVSTVLYPNLLSSPWKQRYVSIPLQPGLAFLYGGLVHRKSVLTIVMQVRLVVRNLRVLLPVID